MAVVLRPLVLAIAVMSQTRNMMTMGMKISPEKGATDRNCITMMSMITEPTIDPMLGNGFPPDVGGWPPYPS